MYLKLIGRLMLSRLCTNEYNYLKCLDLHSIIRYYFTMFKTQKALKNSLVLKEYLVILEGSIK